MALCQLDAAAGHAEARFERPTGNPWGAASEGLTNARLALVSTSLGLSARASIGFVLRGTIRVPRDAVRDNIATSAAPAARQQNSGATHGTSDVQPAD